MPPSGRIRKAPDYFDPSAGATVKTGPAPTIAKAKKAPAQAPAAAAAPKAKPKGKAPAAAAPASPPKLAHTTGSFASLEADPVVDENGLSSASVLASHKMVLQDLAKNSDKYYLLQTIEADGEYYVVRRWGRTGTKGEAKLSDPFATLAEADADLCTTFKDKTGYADPAAADGKAPKAGKYTVLKAAAALAKGKWQYYVDDKIDGKADGWYDYLTDALEHALELASAHHGAISPHRYDYFTDASDIVEGVYAEWKSNPSMFVRCVQSGHFSYMVDLNNMTQTNVSTHKKRQIRRA
eukprot:jgi/Chrpa1/26128/Chrysochromulina_OHIO_Genome00005699-RA